jgi:hypothetical protein
MYQIIYYQTPRGEEVVKSFLDGLEKKVQGKIYFSIALLQEQGPNLKRPYADIVQGKIRELRVRFAHNQIRILYFFFHNDQIILLNGFKKKEWAIDLREIEKARQRMEDWIARNPLKRLQ